MATERCSSPVHLSRRCPQVISSTPRSLGVSREEHSLVLRKIQLPADGTVVFECRAWGSATEPATLGISGDRRAWRPVAPAGSAPAGEGWHASRRWLIGADDRGEAALRFFVPKGAASPAAPLFYDSFRLLHEGHRDLGGRCARALEELVQHRLHDLQAVREGSSSGGRHSQDGRRGVNLLNSRAHGFLTGM